MPLKLSRKNSVFIIGLAAAIWGFLLVAAFLMHTSKTKMRITTYSSPAGTQETVIIQSRGKKTVIQQGTAPSEDPKTP